MWGQGRDSPFGTIAQGNQPKLPLEPQLQAETHNQRAGHIWAEISRLGFPNSGAVPGPAPTPGRTICHQRAVAQWKSSSVPFFLDTPPASGRASAPLRLWLLLHQPDRESSLQLGTCSIKKSLVTLYLPKCFSSLRQS